MFRFFPIFFFLLIVVNSFPSSGFSQEIKGTVSGSAPSGKYIYLWESLGNHSYILDSSLIQETGNFSFRNSTLPQGYYVLSMNDSSRADIILNPSEKEIGLEFTNPMLQEGIRVLSSEENKLLWEYKLISKAVYNALKTIYIEKSNIPEPPVNSGDYNRVQQLEKKIDSLEDYKLNQLKKICSGAPGSFFSRSASYALREKYSSREEEKRHFFETVDFSDVSLIRSVVFPKNIMDYLQKYTEYNEAGFRSSVDTILARSRANPDVYEFCLNFLLEVFDRVGPDIIFQYLAEKYLVGEGCTDINADTSAVGVNKAFRERAEGYRLLFPGNTAPDIRVPDMAGKEKQLSELAGKNKISVLFFWSSHCGFCHEDIPGLIGLYSASHSGGLEIIAFSLDEVKADWEKYVKEKKIPWINISDQKGWKSECVGKYKIHKTPSYYLLDNRMVILSKPGTLEELKKEIDKYLK